LERVQWDLKEAETLIVEKDMIQAKWKEETKNVIQLVAGFLRCLFRSLVS